ncbi:MAG: insulinase family protein [Lachnospiraceae bacterium]|nr:insulinase family protein [Lachnospiraceae bacterium]
MKRFKRLTALVIAFMLAVGSFCIGDGRTQVRADETPMLIATRLAVGAKSHGFTLKVLSEEDAEEGFLQIWEHDKTGAKVYMLVNSDPERAFGILFKTEPSDDTGRLHILEHSCCAASENYPGLDVFFDLSSQGFITDINATTWHSSTNYYLASLDEQELMNGADYYLDCAFHSAVRNDPNYFYREAWRYVLADENDPLDVTGVVYNEMKGSLSDLDSYTLNYVFRHLYPGSNYAYISGGVPETILDITYDELIKFYNLCYHPSNCSVVVYGDVDYNQWLAKFDSYFSEFERETFTAPEAYVPRGDQGTVYDDFPVSADTEDTTGRLLYIWDLPDTMTYAEFNALAILANYENEITSPIMQALNASGIGSAYVLSTYSLGDQRQFLVYAYDADTSRAKDFKKIVDDEFKSIAKSTLDKETIDCMFEEEALSDELALNTNGIGVSCVSAITRAIEAQDIEGMILDNDLMDKIRDLVEGDGVLKLFNTAVVKNSNKLLYAVTPKPGLAEEKDAALAKKLADKKASMSKKEIKALIAQNAAYNEWNSGANSTDETLAKLVTADPSKLDIESPVYDTKLTKKNGVTIATANIDSDVSFYRYSFDISNLSKTKVKYLNEYISFLGLSTTTRTQEQVSNDARKYVNSFSARIAYQTVNGKDIPCLVVSFYAFNDKLEQALDHVFDMLYNTDVKDDYNAAYIAQMLSYAVGTFTDPGNMNGSLSAIAGGYTSRSYALSRYLNGINEYNFLKNAISSEEAFDKFLNGMAKSMKKVVKRQNAVIRVVGSKESRKASVYSMLARLPKKNKKYGEGSIMNIKMSPKNVGIEMNTQAAFMLSVYSPESYDIKETAAEMVALAIISNEVYIPQFRYVLGAYGAYCGATSDGLVYAQLYRSPEFIGPYEEILTTPDYLEYIATMIDEEYLEGYKLQLISQLITPNGKWNMANENLYYVAAGEGHNPAYDIAKAIQELTVDDIIAVIPAVREAFENMGTAVIGTTEEIEANKDMFDKVYILK